MRGGYHYVGSRLHAIGLQRIYGADRIALLPNRPADKNNSVARQNSRHRRRGYRANRRMERGENIHTRHRRKRPLHIQRPATACFSERRTRQLYRAFPHTRHCHERNVPTQRRQNRLRIIRYRCSRTTRRCRQLPLSGRIVRSQSVGKSQSGQSVTVVQRETYFRLIDILHQPSHL